MPGYAPSEAARRSGFSLDTLRYYERIGLLNEVGRTSGGRRVFTDDDLDWLMLFRCLRDTGMPIAEMCRYAELVREGEHTTGERQALLERHAGRVEERMHLLQRQYDRLRAKIRAYDQRVRPR
ncbi:MerR family transcriptional regulator [Salinispora arenicola]|uniref:Transcriptional regulator, MerR family n=1 Tax=Salinispora arenicola (strain CNS-205) TaxID=391037 RepID=A8LYE9_SALAI|nr:MerR family transcriptional regulator [Salinispora arenicola]MCN0181196.1 MerR family transcriptional regulator [Salinispora arenicola]NIL40429.1 MerR family transcriptional regulator [Salinispora arenicola]NIL58529.1 MerR family transcriptional regulator [Salinispora arenicola]NIL60204.1 MerR family transcriptional regulator [Salinispora arenicola]